MYRHPNQTKPPADMGQTGRCPSGYDSLPPGQNTIRRVASALLLLIMFSATALSQGSIQLTLTGVSPMLPSPMIADIERNYHQGQYMMQVHYSSPNPEPVAFYYEVALLRYDEELFRTVSHPVYYTPGTYYYRQTDDDPPISFPEDLYELLSKSLGEPLVREGMLPEGDYTLEIDLFTEDPFISVASVPSVTFFSVRYPQPPVLIFPLDEGLAPPVFAVFTWTPVIGMPMMQFEYELLIVEMAPGQTPLQAIEANREHLLITTRQPVFVYTQEHLPLEEDNEYAWQVTAREINEQVPVGDGGRSEIQTFTVGKVPFDFDPRLLTRIELVPDFAELLIEPDRVDLAMSDYSVTINGAATLRLDLSLAGGGMMEIGVGCYDLVVMMGGMDRPVVVGGEVFGDVRAEVFPHQGVGEIVTLEHIRYTTGEGLTLGAQIIDPGGLNLEATGTLSLTPGGLYGQITATGHEGDPLFSIGMHPVELNISSVSATFLVSYAYLSVDANLRFFGQEGPCRISNLVLPSTAPSFGNGTDTETPVTLGAGTGISFFCDIGRAFQVIPGSDVVSLFLNQAYGEIFFSWRDNSFDYDMTSSGVFRLQALGTNDHDIPLQLGLSSSSGVSATIWPPPMLASSPPLDLGVAQLIINRFDHVELAYDHTAHEWDFQIDFDASLTFPVFDNLRLPDLHGISLDRHGIRIPAVHFDEDDLVVAPRLSLAGFGARLTSFTIPAFTFPWFEWEGMMPGPWDFSFGFELTTPDFPNYLPACLQNLSLHVPDASFSGGEFSAHLPVTSFADDECAYTLGAGYQLAVNELGGALRGIVEGTDFSLSGHLTLDGSLGLGTPFGCEEQTDTQLSLRNITMNSAGLLAGEVTGLTPGCPVSIGPYEASITQAELIFSTGNPTQKAVLNASANLQFPVQAGGMRNFSGSLGLDLITGRFTSLDFSIDEPFIWSIPTRDEVLRFEINSAAITLDGLLINGQQRFMAGNHPVNVTFNELVLDLQTFRIKEGSIQFHDSFAMEAGIDPDNLTTLLYRAVPPGEKLSLEYGMLFGLAGNVVIDAGGLRASGSADATFAFGDISLDDLSVHFSDDFGFGLDPFAVSSGQIDILYQDALVAIIDQDGIRFVLPLSNLLSEVPQHLPLPNMDIAYLVLRDDQGNLLVDVQQDPESELGLVIGTRPGQPVSLVLPVLQAELATPPEIGVHFSQVGISLTPVRFEKGTLSVDVSGMAALFDLEERFGIPFSLKEILYGDPQTIFGPGPSPEPGQDLSFPAHGLFFSGELTLFEEEIGDHATVAVYVQDDGTLRSWFDLPHVGHGVSLVPGSEVAMIHVDALSGELRFPLIDYNDPPYFSFAIDGAFELQAGHDHKARATFSATYDRQGFSLGHGGLQYEVTARRPKINIDPFILRVDQINSLSLSYTRAAGVSFYAGLDLSLGMILGEDTPDTLLVPLRGIEIRETGLTIPPQNIHQDSDPALQVPAAEFYGVHVQPLAFGMDGLTINIYDPDPAELLGLLPQVDLAITFPVLAAAYPQLDGLALHVYEAGYSNRSFTGSIELFNPLQPIRIRMGSTYLDLMQFAGELAEGGAAISIEGQMPLPEIFQSDEAQPCPKAPFTLHVTQGSGFSGTIESFHPCGAIPLGELSLSFSESMVSFAFEEGTQQAMLSGGASLVIPRRDDHSEPITASGQLQLDLISGELADGEIVISNPFHWGFPANDPFFTFVVNTAKLNKEGLTLTSQGELVITESLSADVSFDNLLIGLDDLSIKSGEASITSSFSFEISLSNHQWQMVAPGSPVPQDADLVRFHLDGIGVKLDQDGVSLTGNSTADIYLREREWPEHHDDNDEPDGSDEPGTPQEPGDPGINDEEEGQRKSYTQLDLRFTDDFRLHIPPSRQAKSGRAELWQVEEEEKLLAWYDTLGFGFDNVLELFEGIPDTLGLPDPAIAYMVLREDGELMVELSRDQNVNTLSTIGDHGVKVVIAAFSDDDGKLLSFRTSFQISVNDNFDITQAAISIDLENGEMGNEPLKIPGLPVTLTGIQYETGGDNQHALTASARIDLPESLGDLQVDIPTLRFSQNGFEAAEITVGSQDQNSEPLASHAFADDAMIIELFYVDATFSEGSDEGLQAAFSVHGSIGSSLFAGDAEEEDDQQLHSFPFSLAYHENGWTADLDIGNLAQEYAISHARFQLHDNVMLEVSDEEVALTLSGIITMPDLLGDEFALTINDLKLSTQSGISVGGVEAHGEEQEFSLFDGKVVFTVTAMSPEYDRPVLYVSLDGSIEVLGVTASYDGLKIGTDGSLEIAGINLAQQVNIIENVLAITGLGLQTPEEGGMQLDLTASLTLPSPFPSEPSEVAIEILRDPEGEVSFKVSTLAFDFSDEPLRVEFADIATFDLTALALEPDFDDMDQTALYAAALLTIHTEDADGNASPKQIRFGEAGNVVDNYGLRISKGAGVSWQASGDIEGGFTFSAGFFSITVNSIEPKNDDEGDFVVELNGLAGLNLPNLVEGSIGFRGFQVGRRGIHALGNFTEALSVKIANVVTLSLENFTYEKYDTPQPRSILADDVTQHDDGEPDPDNPQTDHILVLEYLLVEGASVSLNGMAQDNGNGEDAGNDAAWGGGVEKVLFYRTDDGIFLQIEDAELNLPAAEINVNMTMHTIGGFSLSVAGRGSFGVGEAEAISIGVAGKIASVNDQLSFGLFVRADVTAGIPIFPGIITLTGLGGGFYYNPDATDFEYVRTAADMTFIAEPEMAQDIKFAVFLYAGIGLIGQAEYYIDGKFFMEITGGFTSLYVDAQLFYQGDRLKTYMALIVEYGANKMVQGRCRLAVDYGIPLNGTGEIGFFAKPGPGSPPVIWAVTGESNVNFFIVNTTSDFIICNDGMLVNLNINANYDSRIIKIDGNLDASIWYLSSRSTTELGAYGEIQASISIGGASANGRLMGAFITSGGERLLYVQGRLEVDVLLWSGSTSAWASYSSKGLEAGRGANAGYEQLIADARRQAESLRETAEQAKDEVEEALAELDRIRREQELEAQRDAILEEYMDILSNEGSNMQYLANARSEMEAKIAEVLALEQGITDRLQETISRAWDMREQAQTMALELENPMSFTAGQTIGEDETLVVEQNPSIQVNASAEQRNEQDLAEHREFIASQTEFYEEAIAHVLADLRDLEMITKGQPSTTQIFLNTSLSVLGQSFASQFSTILPNVSINLQGVSTGLSTYSAPSVSTGPTSYSPPSVLTGPIIHSTPSVVTGPAISYDESHNFNNLSEKYTEAIESIQRYYQRYIMIMYLWNDLYIHHDAYDPEYDELFRTAIRRTLEQAEEDHDRVLPPLQQMHAAFTGSVDMLYGLKAEITATLYGMIEEYFFMLAELPDQDHAGVNTQLNNLRSEIARMLQFPTIVSFTVNPANPLFRLVNNARIEWMVDHPHSVAETSIMIQPVRRGAIGMYTSAGMKNDLRHYTWQRPSDYFAVRGRGYRPVNENTYNISLRARGGGGQTNIRSTSVSLRVHIDGESSSGGEQLADDGPPPSTPTIELPDYRNVVVALTPGLAPGASGSFGGAMGGLHESRYLTHDANRIKLTITAHDRQSDITRFEFSLGSSRGETDIRDWTEAVGVSEIIGGGAGTTRRMETVMRNLNLLHEGRYFIGVRVTNNFGKQTEYHMSQPLFCDLTPPEPPTAQMVLPTGIQYTLPGSTSSQPTTYPVVYDTPNWHMDKFYFPNHAGPPSLSGIWNPGSDPESGIWGYEYILTPIAEADMAFQQEAVDFTTETRVTFGSDIVSYTDTYYLHIRSKNNAGNVSQPLTYGPMMATDPSPPGRPVMHARLLRGGVRLYFPQLSADLESQVKGYQYSIGTSAGGTDVRGWGTDIDIPQTFNMVFSAGMTMVVPNDPVQIPRHYIPGSEASHDQPLYVNVRAVNGQDMVSQVVSSGPFILDLKPEMPRLSFTFDRKTGALDMAIQNIIDRGAAIASLSYRVIDIKSGKPLQNWADVPGFNPGKFFFAQSANARVNIGTEAGEHGLTLEVRVTNSAGRSTTATLSQTTNSGLVSGFGNILGM